MEINKTLEIVNKIVKTGEINKWNMILVRLEMPL
jgi:hypothetical protein